jgi:serine/threonine protein kinase
LNLFIQCCVTFLESHGAAKRRKAITEPEARFFMHQLLLGVKHLHENKFIH